MLEGWHVSAVGSIAASQLRGLRFDPEVELLFIVFYWNVLPMSFLRFPASSQQVFKFPEYWMCMCMAFRTDALSWVCSCFVPSDLDPLWPWPGQSRACSCKNESAWVTNNCIPTCLPVPDFLLVQTYYYYYYDNTLLLLYSALAPRLLVLRRLGCNI